MFVLTCFTLTYFLVCVCFFFCVCLLLQGDTIEDLCEPEFDDELNTLKKHCEQQQNNCRKRSNALSKRLIHTNSREEAMGKHPSPQIVRRRLG